MAAKVQFQFQRQPNVSGDAQVATQGFGRVSRGPVPAFGPAREIDQACAFFERHGYVVLADCLSPAELAQLNEFCDRSQRERPDAWGLGERRKPHHTNQGMIFWSRASWAARSMCGIRSSTSARRRRARASGR
jgi:hypothetical protein